MSQMDTIENIRERVISAVEEQLCIAGENVTVEKGFVADLGCDSLDMVEMAMTLEDEFGVEISDEEMDATVTVQNAVDLVAKKLNVTS